MNLRFRHIAARVAALSCLAVLLALPAAAQSVNLFPANRRVASRKPGRARPFRLTIP